MQNPPNSVHRPGRCRFRKAYSDPPRSGVAAVEFAAVLPILFLLVLGMIEYGRLVMVQQILTNAAREGARVGVSNASTVASVSDAANQYLTAANIKNATVTVSPNPPSAATEGSPVSVTVAVGFDQVSWLPSPFYLSGTTMSYTAIMRRETIP